MQPRLQELFAERFGAPPSEVAELRAHGSDRKLWRLHAADGRTAIGVENPDLGENAAFTGFAAHFRASGLPMPEIYAEDRAAGLYLEEDLGDMTLFDLLNRERGDSSDVPSSVAAVYEKTVRLLPRIQIEAGRGIDYGLCYPREAFDRRSMMWDLNYFKYYFLKLAGVPVHEQKLENDFDALCGFLLQADREHFLYRDFQSRNVMVRDGEPWFIDFQGGRKGALHYDLASILLDAKANLPFEFRDRLRQVYLRAANEIAPLDVKKFERHYRGYALIRILQAMGAYGFRGFYERKAHFLQSVPYAIRNLEHLLEHGELPVQLPALWDALHKIVRSTRLREIAPVPLMLTVRVTSFSYKGGYPPDETGHGGGFVFDCRALPNPGREKQFVRLTGRDADCAAWLAARQEVSRFMEQSRALVLPAVATYRERNFTHLSVAFGCTGGQHRSVWCAEQLAAELRAAGVRVDLRHRDMPDFST
jgi:aminoglycoside/choline kinase family phosphotransferase